MALIMTNAVGNPPEASKIKILNAVLQIENPLRQYFFMNMMAIMFKFLSRQ